MGMFDTFIFDAPIQCSECGAAIVSTQSKSFGSLLDTYRVGDVIRDCRIRIGVVEEQCWCAVCADRPNRRETDAWIVVWHGIYAGACASCEAAEMRLSMVDRMTLLEWHGRQQEEKEVWHRRFRSLYADLEAWHRYLLAEDKESFLKTPLGFLRSGLDKYLEEKDPLGALIAAHEPSKDDGSDDLFG
jgi:Zn finger protein HypA/HybF involved in hydrogenase expression